MTTTRFLTGLLAALLAAGQLTAQSLGNAGTVNGTVTDASGAVVPEAEVLLRNALTGYQQQAKSAGDGTFRLTNIPPNSYHMEITRQGFATFKQDLSIRNSVPVSLAIKLTVATETTQVTVEAAGADVLENDPSAHTDVDRSQMLKLPVNDPGAGLSQAITYSTGGVASDANGFFHPLGDHAQVTFVVDGQPISDQQSKVFSTQLPASAVQSMELATGSVNAEFGDKTSLVAQVTTRSGLGSGRTFGNVDSTYGSFGNAGGGFGLGFGNEKYGNFLAVDGARSGRFLDSPEFSAFHDKGNNQTIFDRFDYQPDGADVFHLNLFLARNWIQIPNSYDQLGEDQRQRVLTWSFAPGYQHTFSAKTLLTVNPYIRKDQFNYYGSRDPFQDTPLTVNQARELLNYGVKADVASQLGRHSVKVGIDTKQTRLHEAFHFGITDPGFNPVCVDNDGNAAGPSTLLDPAGCGTLGLTANDGFQPGLLPYDLTRGGKLFGFDAARNINQFAVYAQDSLSLGNLQINGGVRFDRYEGITTTTGFEPRLGVSYQLKKTGTVLRAAYSRTFETPFNENLLLSSATGAGGLATNVFGAAAVAPLQPGRRNQFNTGFQQTIGKWLLFDGDYFWKFTHNAYDFNTLLNSTITFPISWHNSKNDGVTGRLSTASLHGFQAYYTFGHTRARYYGPENGGLLPADLGTSVFRIDHDQAYQSTFSARYQRPKSAEWVSFIWRFDSGLVVSGVPDVDAALQLTPAQQVTIGFACNGVPATLDKPITSCSGTGTSTLVNLPQSGKENDDHNPARVKPRHLFDIGFGSDNLLHKEGPHRIVFSVSIQNLTNRVALYNFLSTFSGTHFVTPRAVTAHIGYVF